MSNTILPGVIPENQKKKCKKVNWDEVSDLGIVQDIELARRYGVSSTAVLNARRSRNIPSPNPMARYSINWDTVPLGEYTDEHLANILGCSKILVFRHRKSRGIPPCATLYRTVENEGAYYGEAIIDAWLHKNNIKHKFQKQIGAYRVDWLLENKVVWEFLGMWDHKIFGEQYQTNFKIKKEYLLSEGYILKEIHKSELNNFKKEVDLKSLLTLGSKFECGGCHRVGVKHHAYGLCGRCVSRTVHGVELDRPIKERLNKNSLFICTNCSSTDRKKQVKGLCSKCYNKYKKTLTSGR